MDSAEARRVIASVGQQPTTVLRALRTELGLSDFVLGGMVERTAQTVRRWRREDEADIPDGVTAVIDDLRAIVAMMVAAEIEGSTIKQFLLSRNTGLGQDRPLDGLRVGLDAFRRVEHVTECFIAGVAPEPGSALVVHRGEEFQPAAGAKPVEPQSPQKPVGVRA